MDTPKKRRTLVRIKNGTRYSTRALRSLFVAAMRECEIDWPVPFTVEYRKETRSHPFAGTHADFHLYDDRVVSGPRAYGFHVRFTLPRNPRELNWAHTCAVAVHELYHIRLAKLRGEHRHEDFPEGIRYWYKTEAVPELGGSPRRSGARRTEAAPRAHGNGAGGRARAGSAAQSRETGADDRAQERAAQEVAGEGPLLRREATAGSRATGAEAVMIASCKLQSQLATAVRGSDGDYAVRCGTGLAMLPCVRGISQPVSSANRADDTEPGGRAQRRTATMNCTHQNVEVDQNSPGTMPERATCCDCGAPLVKAPDPSGKPGHFVYVAVFPATKQTAAPQCCDGCGDIFDPELLVTSDWNDETWYYCGECAHEYGVNG